MNTTLLARNGMLISDQGNEVSSPLSALAGKVRLESGYTLRSFLQMLERYEDFRQISVFIPPLLEEYAGCPEEDCTTGGITHMELVKKAEMIGYPGEPRFNLMCTLIGYLDDLEQELRQYRLKNLLDMPMKLGMLTHSVFGDTVNIMKFETDFTLFEFIEGVAWDFGFQRFPEHCSIRG